SHSGVGFLQGQIVDQINCGNAFIKANELKTKEVRSLVTIAGHIDGNVHTVLDKKGAAVFGLVVASFFMFFKILRRLTR
ncbi:hypothetical protein OAR19_00835, partial [bacterium]|nr:hypothetical protein [bacterium]